MDINKIIGSGSNDAAIESRLATNNLKKPALTASNEPITKQIKKEQIAVNPADLKDSVDEINRFINASNGINLNIDHDSGKVVVQIVDKETNVVLRQIPSAEVLSMIKDFDGKKGLLVKDQA